jgi:hypothetical protein
MDDIVQRLRDLACGGSNWNGTLTDAADTIERLRADGLRLRRLLAVRVAMPHTYYDDGEAHGQQHGIGIDFMREPVADIDAKLRALNVARLECAAAQPERRDWCTDPDNCGRCKAPQWDQHNHNHAGIPLSGIGAA